MDNIVSQNSVPLYLQLKDLITKQIKDGALKPGEKLPSEREFCEKYNVSRITVRQALSELSNEGLISRSHGKGTFVSETKVEQELFTITPFQNSLLSKGLNPKTKYLEFKVQPNSYKVSRILDIPLSEKIVQLNLLGLNDDTPMSYYSSCYQYDLGLKMQEIALQLAESGVSFTSLDLYRAISVKLGGVNQTFEASISDNHISDILKIKKGSPILIVESEIYSDKDQPLEFRTAIYRGDKYKFSIVRRPY